jgi:acyl-CoA dehydrogenase
MTFQPAPACDSRHEEARNFLTHTLPTLRHFDAQLHALAGSARAGGMTLSERHAFLLCLAHCEADLKAITGLARTLAATLELGRLGAHETGAMLKSRSAELKQQMAELLEKTLNDRGMAQGRVPRPASAGARLACVGQPIG